ncbi:MAG: hypothetical protein ABL921_12510 [Pirellula sp.]
MSLKELLGDPSWLFDLGVPVLEFAPTVSNKKLRELEWELGDEHRLPPLSALNGEKRFAESSIAWSDHGLLIHFAVQIDSRVNPKHSLSPPVLTFYVDTRWSPGVHRGTMYCHRIEMLLTRPVSSELKRGHGELTPMQRARASPNPVHPNDLLIGTLRREFGYEIKVFIPTESLTGYEPREFQELGLFYVLRDDQLGRQCMARSVHSPFFEDPSLWCRGKLT